MGRLARIACVAAPTALTVASLACFIGVGMAGLRFSRTKLDGFSFAVVDTSKVETRVGSDTFYGLPDRYDYSHHKDFYAIYLWNYCSGHLKDGRRVVDFCSQPRNFIYGLFSFWKMWGVGLQRQNVSFRWLANGPKMLYVAYLVAMSFKAMELLAGISSVFSRWGSVATLALSTAATLAILATSIFAQVTYAILVARSDDDAIPITATLGRSIFILLWLAFALSLAGNIMWSCTVCCVSGKSSRLKPINGKGPTSAVVEHKGGYEHVKGADRDDTKLLLKEPEMQTRGYEESPRVSDDAYEPFRHKR